MKATMLIIMLCLLGATSNMATAAATAETAAAAKAKAMADSANTEAEAAAVEAAKAADAAEKAAAVAKAAAAAKLATAKAAQARAQEKTAAAKKALAATAKAGARSCEDWKQDRSSKTHSGLATSWLNGFLSGMEIARNQDFLTGIKTESLFSSVDAYCDAHPYEFVSDAGISLYLELARKKGLIQ